MARGKKYWLMKSEPDVFSIDDLKKAKQEPWDGIRNYQARNFMRDEMQVGDGVLFYHSRVKPIGVAGLAEVATKAYPDFTAWDKKSKYFDEKSTEESPVWMLVDIKFIEKFDEVLTLDQLKAEKSLEGMLVTKRGQRLSIQPVEKKHFDKVVKMASRG